MSDIVAAVQQEGHRDKLCSNQKARSPGLTAALTNCKSAEQKRRLRPSSEATYADVQTRTHGVLERREQSVKATLSPPLSSALLTVSLLPLDRKL